MQKGLQAAWKICRKSSNQQLCTHYFAIAERPKIMVINCFFFPRFFEHFLFIHIVVFSFWCLGCGYVPEKSCHDSSHIVLDRSKDVDELCALLLAAATLFSDIVLLREQFHLKLQLKLKGLLKNEEKEAVELLMAENIRCLVTRRSMAEKWAGMKTESTMVNGIFGFISFYKYVEKVIEDMKEESILVADMLLMHHIQVCKINQ